MGLWSYCKINSVMLDHSVKSVSDVIMNFTCNFSPTRNSRNCILENTKLTFQCHFICYTWTNNKTIASRHYKTIHQMGAQACDPNITKSESNLPILPVLIWNVTGSDYLNYKVIRRIIRHVCSDLYKQALTIQIYYTGTLLKMYINDMNICHPSILFCLSLA